MTHSFLTIASRNVTAQISPFGAALARVQVTGYDHSLVLGLDRPEDYAQAPAAIGVIVGPVAGRIRKAQAPLDDVVHQMEANTPPDCLHSGTGGLQNQLWETTSSQTDAVTLSYTLPDGACGLPGTRQVAATYSIVGATLRLEITATSNKDTLFNATSHAYWTLDPSGHLRDQTLCVQSPHMMELDTALIPTGRVVDHTGQAFDFTTQRSPVAGPALDGCFCLADARRDLTDILRLEAASTGLSLTVSSTEPGVVLYTGENLPELTVAAALPRIAPFSALAIEAQGWPDAPNNPQFPSIVLRAGTIQRQVTEFHIQSGHNSTLG